jgi:cobaltochelatase CobN
MQRISVTFLATSNQIDMMTQAASRYDFIGLDAYNLARLTLDEAVSEIRQHDSPDLLVITMPSVADFDLFRNGVESIGARTILSVGKDPRLWMLNTVDKELAKGAYEYISNSGQENYDRLMDYLLNRLFSYDVEIRPHIEVPWHGLVDLNSNTVHQDMDSYRKEYGWDDSRPSVGITLSREAWAADNLGMRRFLFKSLENAGMNVVCLMSKPKDDPSLGAWGFASSFYHMLTQDGRPLIDSFIINSYMLDERIDTGEGSVTLGELFRQLNIPVFCPMELRGMTYDDWVTSNGIGSLETTRITVPEIRGYIEPIPMSVMIEESTLSDYAPIEERCRKIASRIRSRTMLGYKANKDKRLAIMLNIGPCSTVEATLGLAHDLDSMESTVRILRRLKYEGYDVEVPESGEALRDMFLQKRAYPEFRWTSVDDTVDSKGSVYEMDADEYRRMFDSLDRKNRDDVVRVWGEPPGEGMLHDGRIIIAGLRFGNALVMIQPKRGCVGRECSGKYCKVLTDPICPPNHHYLATYLYLDRIWKADAYIGIGSHGSLEGLPGKRNGLSGTCYPDICIGSMPNLYVFDACDLVHASIAKRRAHATMFGHMPSVSSKLRMDEGLRRLSDVLGSFNPLDEDQAYISSYREELKDAFDESNIILTIDWDGPIDNIISTLRAHVSSISSTMVEGAGHVYGEMPDHDTEVAMIAEYLVYDHPDLAYEELTFLAEKVLSGEAAEDIADGFQGHDRGEILGIVNDSSQFIASVRESNEMDSLVNALEGGFTVPGPAGNVLRGKGDIYPTGRNLYGMNPALLPTKVSYAVGRDLADKLLGRYLEDTGEYPEEIALSWMSNDLTIADGELIGQIMALIGVEPVWSSDGRITDFKIVPLEEMDHPRIDVIVRPAGTVISVFKDRLDLVDSMLTAVAQLDEPIERNYLHAHMLDSVMSGASIEEATSRIFGIGPGMGSGLYYAVMASAWETDADLANIFLNNNGYAYGVGKEGKPMHGQFGYQLSKMSTTFNKIASDDKDLLLSGAFFTSQGGLALTSEHLTGKKVRAYYGDTRSKSTTSVRTLSDEIDRLTRAKVLNPDWIRMNMDAGYKGGTAMMSAVQKLYGWKITSKDVDDKVFDGIVREYIENDKVREFLSKENPFAFEDLERRMLELETRGLWTTDEDTLKSLKESYLTLEGDLEGFTDDPDCQRGEVIVTRMTDEYSIGRDMERTRAEIDKRLGR